MRKWRDPRIAVYNHAQHYNICDQAPTALESEMEPGTIIISSRHMDLLRRHASSAGGGAHESCALLFGTRNTVREVYLADNADENPGRRFAIPPEQLIEAYGAAERKGLEVIGIFHSHPASGAFPSETDVQFMRTNPVVWVIHSGTDGTTRAYVLDEDGVTPTGIAIVEAADDGSG